MKPRTKPLQARVDDVLPSFGPITKDNFHERLLQHFRLNPSDYVVIRPEYETPADRLKGDAAMHAWWAYLGWKGFDKTRRFWEYQLQSGKSVTVSCGDPSLFDFDYEPRQNAAE